MGRDSFTQCVLYVLCMCLFPQTPETIGMERILFGGNEWMEGWRDGYACMYVCMYVWNEYRLCVREWVDSGCLGLLEPRCRIRGSW